MADLKKHRKADLIVLADELGIGLEANSKISEIIAKIMADENFDEELINCQLKIIKEEREENEKENKERQKEQRDREERLTREALEREHELAKLQLATSSDTASINSVRDEVPKVISLKSLMSPFDPEKSEISLFLALFEKQAKKVRINTDDWVVQLLPLLPIKLAEGIMKLPDDQVDDFEKVKEYLLERFRVNAETYRNKFIHSQRSGLWKDFAFEMRSYLEGWISQVEVKTFDDLIDLMISDQIKRRMTPEMREKFLDKLSQMNNPEDLAKELDEYESVRKPYKRVFPKPQTEDRRTDRHTKIEKPRNQKPIDKKPFNWREKSEVEKAENTKIFEKRKPLICFNCSSPGHMKYSCPQLKRENVMPINNVEQKNGLEESLNPYMSNGKVNGKEFVIWRDTGSNTDVISMKLINPEQLNGEVVWLKSPLENEFRCLPVATVSLDLPNVGHLQTKAAVVDSTVDLKYYILGNETQNMIEKIKREPALMNAVITRSRARVVEETESEKCLPSLPSAEETGEEKRGEGEENEREIVLPGVERESSLCLSRVLREELIAEQKIDPLLTGLWEKAETEENKEYRVQKDMLFRFSKDHHGRERKQIVVPLKYRDEILKLCHEGISAHVGASKTKDKILRCYFWPHIVKDVENFVQTCDSCQRVNKGGDVKRVPLKLVPIISQIFQRLNTDIVGPLPESEKGNKYLLTAMCMASKYPEAIPLPDTKSETIIEGLLMIFSRLGFCSELQCDLGSCFTSTLTTTFCERFGIRIIHSSVHRPQSNPVERWHRTVKRLLRVLCVENGESWEKNLPHALLALRTVTHDSTGFSPAELVHGKNLRTPETLLFEKWAEVENEETPVTEYIFALINRLKKCQELAVENMENSREKRKIWYDKGTVERSFKPGDQVLVMATARPNKLSVNWIGPGTIETKISETNYVVNVPGRREKSQIYHINLIKPYYQRIENINVLMQENLSPENLEADLDISYPSENQEIYDFCEIVRLNELEKKCSPKQISQLEKILNKHKNLFSNDPGCTDMIEHDIELITEQPFRIKPYRTSPRQAEILKREIKRMLKLKLIEPAESDYVSPMILVEVPGKDPRPCIDYRKLNTLTRVEYFPLPNIEERVEQVAAAKYITLIDLTKGYWQIPLTERAQRYAAFSTTFGVYKMLVMPFGLIGSSYRFSKFMSDLLMGCEEFCVPYIDDIAIFSETWEDHMKHLEIILKKLEEAKVKIKPAKCKFAQDKVNYLGHVVGGGIRKPAEAKVKAVLDFKNPTSKTEIRKILGMIGYYSKYIKDYATIVEPLTRALKGKEKKESVNWTDEMEKAFKEIKKRLTENPILYAPNFNLEFILQTDASQKGIGVVLAQRINNEEHPILYLSRKFTGAEKNYSVTEKECAAIIHGIKKLKPYLDGQKFLIETDHNPLVFLKTNAGNNQRLMRWALALQPYDYTVQHRPGKSITHVDTLSRI